MSSKDLLSNQFKPDNDSSIRSGTSFDSIDSGERKLAALGYTQQLNRGFTTFTNFAVSFSIISILTGVTGKDPIHLHVPRHYFNGMEQPMITHCMQ